MTFLFVVCVLAAVWLLVALVCVGLCMSAAEGDRGMGNATVRTSRAPRRFARDFGPAA